MKNINVIEFKEVICELLHVDKEEVNINTKLSDLNLDSLDYMQLFYDIEEKFNIETRHWKEALSECIKRIS